ncbi:replication-associated protein RepX [Lactococcus lactis]|uniref:replication-associated protein RepX n=1 Tax=Lactococcus lactis TaxID=1358 RepID=UPI00223A79EF|nr:replication-associated protein RepX [Lactococcus lactis]MCT1226966.1 replication-associated protein RepX [Lactococcus lactis]
MSENLKTIKELADELGVSKTYIEKIIRVVNIHSELLKKKNRFFLNIKQQEIIKNYLDKPPTQAPTAGKEPPTQAPTAGKEPPTQAPTAGKEPPTQAPTADKEPPTQAPTADVVFLQNELVKRGVEIDKLHELLDQQQRLALQDKKLLEEYKAENDRLKVLKMPSHETEFKHLDNQYKDEVDALKEKLENLQEQIKVQKRIEEQEKPRKWWELWRK